uniref:Uncharacterized protein n=1 Tax=Arundo donax TaxID=35708 RepID=A0A0A9FEB9_ARUDO
MVISGAWFFQWYFSKVVNFRC